MFGDKQVTAVVQMSDAGLGTRELKAQHAKYISEVEVTGFVDQVR